MKTLFSLFILLSPILSWAQTQTKSQCMTTVRVRSMSISSADAEKLCAEDSADVANCAVTKLQGSHPGSISDSLKACRTEWGVATPAASPTATTQSPTSVTVPVSNPSSDGKDNKKPDGNSEAKGNFEEI